MRNRPLTITDIPVQGEPPLVGSLRSVLLCCANCIASMGRLLHVPALPPVLTMSIGRDGFANELVDIDMIDVSHSFERAVARYALS